jgi:hypothetical protein
LTSLSNFYDYQLIKYKIYLTKIKEKCDINILQLNYLKSNFEELLIMIKYLLKTKTTFLFKVFFENFDIGQKI